MAPLLADLGITYINKCDTKLVSMWQQDPVIISGSNDY